MTQEVVARVWALTEPALAHEGFELVDVEYRRENRGLMLRFFLDREGGITIDELARASRLLGDVLDVHDVIPNEYVLECSSPGIDRRLRRPEHFRRYVGQRVRVKTRLAQAGRRMFVGRLEGADDEAVEIVDAQGARHRVRYADIDRANYEADL